MLCRRRPASGKLISSEITDTESMRGCRFKKREGEFLRGFGHDSPRSNQSFVVRFSTRTNSLTNAEPVTTKAEPVPRKRKSKKKND
jgi:hypothetical protein